MTSSFDSWLDLPSDINNSMVSDFLISSSYGPGRYDDNYEINGQDYPLAYVRWTLNRNMQTYIDMIDKELISFDFLVYLKHW